MLAHGTTTWEGKSGYGLDRETELASLRAVRAAGGSPTWLGAHAVPPEHGDADAYLDYVLADVLPDAARLADAADVFLERGAFDAAQARRYLEACRGAGLALRLHGDQFTESGAVPLAIDLGARSVDHLEATGDVGVEALGYSDVVAVLLPASALFLDRPMPPARALVDAGAAIALATDFNPGSSFTTSLPLIASLACTQLHLAPEEALVAMTVNAAHVARRVRPRPARSGDARRRHAARRTRLALPRVPPGRRSRRRRSFAAEPPSTGGNLAAMPTRKQRRRREKDFRHDVRVYEVDEEGNEVPIAELRAQDERAAKPKPKSASKRGPARTRAARRRSRRRGTVRSSAAG